MKNSRLIGIVWILLALYDLFLAIHDIYKYSNPWIDWFLIVPIWITFGKIFTGTIGLIIGISLLRKIELRLTFPLAVTLVLYIIIDFFKMGFELFPISGSNLLYLGVALLTLKLNGKLERSKLVEQLNRQALVIIAIGLTPYLLSGWASYEWFNFLH